MICDVCGDNRFEIIEKAKTALIESTNIETSENEMKVIDSFLFRCWQMGWLNQYDDGEKERTMSDLINRADAIKAVHKYFVDKINNEPHEIDEDGDNVFTDMKSVNALFHHNKMVSKAIKALPSAKAVKEEE